MDDAGAIVVGLNDAEFLLRASGALVAVVVVAAVVDVDVSFSGIGLFRFRVQLWQQQTFDWRDWIFWV